MTDCRLLTRQYVQIHGAGREQLLPLLQHLNKENGFLDQCCLSAVAEELNISPAEVFGTAGFYNFLDLAPRGKYIVRVCNNVSCRLQKEAAVVEAISRYLRIKPGETTTDGRFSLLGSHCLGRCDQSPAMLVNNQIYTGLNPEKAIDILKEYLQK